MQHIWCIRLTTYLVPLINLDVTWWKNTPASSLPQCKLPLTGYWIFFTSQFPGLVAARSYYQCTCTWLSLFSQVHANTITETLMYTDEQTKQYQFVIYSNADTSFMYLFYSKLPKIILTNLNLNYLKNRNLVITSTCILFTSHISRLAVARSSDWHLWLSSFSRLSFHTMLTDINHRNSVWKQTVQHQFVKQWNVLHDVVTYIFECAASTARNMYEKEQTSQKWLGELPPPNKLSSHV